MERLLMIAFWIVTLCNCLPAKSLPIEDFKIHLMNKTITCPKDSRFYTPSNVEPRCFAAALQCFATELNGTVKAECDDPKKAVNKAVNSFVHYGKELEGSVKGNATSNDCQCESWPTTPFNKFLSALKTLLQHINSMDGH